MTQVQLTLYSKHSALRTSLPHALVDKLDKRAKRMGVTQKRYIRLVLERAANRAPNAVK
jgi:hypothetical protein